MAGAFPDSPTDEPDFGTIFALFRKTFFAYLSHFSLETQLKVSLIANFLLVLHASSDFITLALESCGEFLWYFFEPIVVSYHAILVSASYIYTSWEPVNIELTILVILVLYLLLAR
jgi:hypothetical protein